MNFGMDNEPDPCLFPFLDGGGTGVGATTAYREVSIEAEKLPDISEFCEINETNKYAFFKVVWSIILSRFTEMQLLYFAINMGSASASAMTDNGTSNGFLEKPLTVHKVSITPETKLKDLFGISSPLLDPHDRHRYRKFNTALAFCHDDAPQLEFSDGDDQVGISFLGESNY